MGEKWEVTCPDRGFLMFVSENGPLLRAEQDSQESERSEFLASCTLGSLSAYQDRDTQFLKLHVLKQIIIKSS